MRRQYSIARFGRKLGGIVGFALVALVYWFQEDGRPPETMNPSHSDASQATPSEGGAVPHPAQEPRTTGIATTDVPPGSYTLRGTVSKVADGDTVTLMVNGKSHRVRLDSIDAPEAGHGDREPGQPYARAAQQHLQTLVGGKTLTAHCYKKDQYDREVCALILPDGESANRKMVASGYAWAYTARRNEYLGDTAMPSLQTSARRAGVGLWAQRSPIEPWRWRYECWRNQRCEP